jgi:hypothetical protein
MSANTSDLFPLVTLPSDDAPEKIRLRSGAGSSEYGGDWHVVVKRRFGAVTPQQFLNYGSRMLTIVRTVFADWNPKLIQNEGVPIGRAYVAATYDAYEGETGEEIDLTSCSPADFERRFQAARTMVLRINGSLGMQWTRERPKTLFFDSPRPRTVDDALARKMFYTSDSRPGWNTKILLGLGEYIDEAEGKEGKTGNCSPEAFGAPSLHLFR